VAWACAQCGQGLLLDEQHGLVPLEIHYAAGIPPNTPGKPFWVAEGKVHLQGRQTYSGREERDAQAFWSSARRFFLPAFSAPLETLLSLGMNSLLQPPALPPGPPAHFEPVTLWPEDLQSAAEFIIMAIEAGRKDKLKELNFTLELSDPALWILP
jgi:hypothetical protein